MAALDRLTWGAGVAVVRYGVRVGVRATDTHLLNDIEDYLPPGCDPCPSNAVDCLFSLRRTRPDEGMVETELFRDAERVVRTDTRDVVLLALESAARFELASRTRQRLFVHAGVVRHRGRAIVIPGISGAGKSTLVAALVKAGGVYYSDEFAVFDRRGQIEPYPSPIRLIPAAGGLKVRRPVEELGGHAGTTPIPVGLIVDTRYASGARWQPRPLTAAESLLALLPHTVVARQTPAMALAILNQVVTGVPAWRGRRGDAARVAASLLGAYAHGPRSGAATNI